MGSGYVEYIVYSFCRLGGRSLGFVGVLECFNCGFGFRPSGVLGLLGNRGVWSLGFGVRVLGALRALGV